MKNKNRLAATFAVLGALSLCLTPAAQCLPLDSARLVNASYMMAPTAVELPEELNGITNTNATPGAQTSGEKSSPTVNEPGSGGGAGSEVFHFDSEPAAEFVPAVQHSPTDQKQGNLMQTGNLMPTDQKGMIPMNFNGITGGTFNGITGGSKAGITDGSKAGITDGSKAGITDGSKAGITDGSRGAPAGIAGGGKGAAQLVPAVQSFVPAVQNFVPAVQNFVPAVQNIMQGGPSLGGLNFGTQATGGGGGAGMPAGLGAQFVTGGAGAGTPAGFGGGGNSQPPAAPEQEPQPDSDFKMPSPALATPLAI